MTKTPPQGFLKWVSGLPRSRAMEEMKHFKETGEIRSKEQFFDFLLCGA